jgi:hypothetical protein
MFNGSRCPIGTARTASLSGLSALYSPSQRAQPAALFGQAQYFFDAQRIAAPAQALLHDIWMLSDKIDAQHGN